jgi:putative dimethyl sulfoxide reductase chaperone
MHPVIQESDYPSQAVLRARADCCRLLAACFYPPDKKLLLEESITERLGELLHIACPGIAPPPSPVQHEGDSHLALSVAYTRLFLGPPEMLAPPYASFYLDQGGRLMGPSSIEMMKYYKRAGLRIDDDFNDMPDHVAVALEFLYYLLFRELTAEIENDQEEKTKLENTRISFWNSYIVSWVPRFCHLIVTADEHPFYTGLGHCLDRFARNFYSSARRA